ncbi:MAG: thioredoxin domain-containing protein [Patescibacteria group bacterium]
MENETHMEHHQHPPIHTNKKGDLSIPLAIVIAGIIVGGAIIFSSNTRPATNTGQQLTAPKFSACLASGKYAGRVQKDFESGGSMGINGTPFTMIWNRKTGKQMPIEGAYPFENVKNIVDGVVAEKQVVQPVYTESEAPVTLLELRPEDHVLGNTNADVLMVEYSDPECPFCKRFHETMHQVVDHYGKNGNVAWVYRHYPIDQLHSKARKEAEAMECASEQGGNDAFWKYADKLFEVTPSNNGLDAAQLPVIAAMVGLK